MLYLLLILIAVVAIAVAAKARRDLAAERAAAAELSATSDVLYDATVAALAEKELAVDAARLRAEAAETALAFKTLVHDAGMPSLDAARLARSGREG